MKRPVFISHISLGHTKACQLRVQDTPWLCVERATGKKVYVYSMKGLYSKGANRLMTTLHAMIMAIKNDTTHPSQKARTLVLIADNFMENKNNTVFAGLQHFVVLGWFDEVQMLLVQSAIPTMASTRSTPSTMATWDSTPSQTLAMLLACILRFGLIPPSAQKQFFSMSSTTGMISISPISAS